MSLVLFLNSFVYFPPMKMEYILQVVVYLLVIYVYLYFIHKNEYYVHISPQPVIIPMGNSFVFAENV